MVCGVFTIRKIPAEKVDGVVDDFNIESPPPVSVEKTENADGTFTVVATFPPCPPNTKHKSGTGEPK